MIGSQQAVLVVALYNIKYSSLKQVQIEAHTRNIVFMEVVAMI